MRFYGDPHFWVAAPARTAAVLVSLLALFALRRVTTQKALTRIFLSWEAVISISVSLLVSSHSDLAFFAVILVPGVFYLAAPTPFAITAAMSIACTVALLVGFLSGGASQSVVSSGIVIAMLMLNALLAIVLNKNNRLQRLQHMAMQAERRANLELAASRQDLEKIFMAVPIPLIVTDRTDGRILRTNSAALRFYGSVDAIRAKKLTTNLFAGGEALRRDLLQQLAQRGYVDSFEARITMPDGSERDLLLSSTLISIDGHDCLITGGVDISARKALQAKLEQLATLDPLTGCFNRAAFCELGTKEIARARRDGARVSLIMIDLDYFKLINDAFGHAAGDRTLVAFTELCRGHLRAQDCLGRIGGEEFAIMLPDTDRVTAGQIAERLRHAAENMKIDDSNPGLCVTISAGVSEVDIEDEPELNSALARADLALYAAKMRGRNKVMLTGETEDVVESQGASARQIMSASL